MGISVTFDIPIKFLPTFVLICEETSGSGALKRIGLDGGVLHVDIDVAKFSEVARAIFYKAPALVGVRLMGAEKVGDGITRIAFL
jgi:hypothetical protein